MQGINRIRLEFKVLIRSMSVLTPVVLIESDWNLKCFFNAQYTKHTSINRIRLEFKVYTFS